MQKAEVRLRFCIQPIPVTTHRFQQAESAHDIGLDKIFRAVNGAIHMTFRCKVHNGAWLMLCQQLCKRFTITDIGLHKNMT